MSPVSLLLNDVSITKEFLQQMLKRDVINLKITEGSNPGDNYTSILISLEVCVPDQNEPLHLLFKTFPNHPIRQKYLEETNILWKEYQIYSTWLPELISFQKEIIGNEKMLVPAMPEFVAGAAIDYQNAGAKEWSKLDPFLSNFVLMVDVRKTHGFKMESKLKSLGYDQVKVVLEELAKYHVLGHAYKHHHNLTSVRSKFSFMEDNFYCSPEQRPMMEEVLESNLELIFKSCKEFLEGNPKIKESLAKFKPNLIMDYLVTFLKPEGVDEGEIENWSRTKPMEPPIADQWIVAGHGDCWTNNMLFKTNENGIADKTVLVDLQIARESCITTDLVYFLYTSVDTEFRNKQLTNLLSWYFQRFVDFCGILKAPLFPGFTMENFQRKFQRAKVIGFSFALMVIPIVLQRPETAVNMDGGEAGEKDDYADFFKRERSVDEIKLLRDRFINLFVELYEQGVL